MSPVARIEPSPRRAAAASRAQAVPHRGRRTIPVRELLAVVALIALFLFDPRTAFVRPSSAPTVAPAAEAPQPLRRAAPVHQRVRGAARTVTPA
jgi:hypothetical protein